MPCQRQTMSNHQISDSFGVFVCFLYVLCPSWAGLGQFHSISSNVGFHSAEDAEGITANLCDANTLRVAQLQILSAEKKKAKPRPTK